MDNVTIIGLLAALLSTLSMAPQVIKVYKTKKTRDLSLGAFTTLSVSLFLWFIYGLLMKAIPLIAGNALGFILVAYLVVMKARHG